jgi:hypothetical protein
VRPGVCPILDDSNEPGADEGPDPGREPLWPVIDELDEQPRSDAETAIQEARVPSRFPATPENDESPDSRTPETRVEAANPGRWS